MNTIPQTDAQFFQLPRGGAERTMPASQPTFTLGKILNGATIYCPVRFLNGLTGFFRATPSKTYQLSTPNSSLPVPNVLTVSAGFCYARLLNAMTKMARTRTARPEAISFRVPAVVLAHSPCANPQTFAIVIDSAISTDQPITVPQSPIMPAPTP